MSCLFEMFEPEACGLVSNCFVCITPRVCFGNFVWNSCWLCCMAVAACKVPPFMDLVHPMLLSINLADEQCMPVMV